MSEQEDREFDRTIGFLDSSQSEYLDRAGEKAKRSRFELLGEILLLLAEEPVTSSTLFWKLRSNFMQLRPLLEVLLRKEFIQRYRIRRSSKLYYSLTEKGEQAAVLYKKAKSLFED